MKERCGRVKLLASFFSIHCLSLTVLSILASPIATPGHPET